MTSLWYCCGCNFGPHNSSLYVSCIQCGEARCPRCIEQKEDSLSININIDSHSHSHSNSCNPISAYPTAVMNSPPSTPTLEPTASPIVVPDLPGLRTLPRVDCSGISPVSLSGTRYNSETYMYICCECNDGPKIYNHQPQCVVCNHMACAGCTYVK
ncbi:uncharacterized protein N7515_000664 [Penicillium bovifimosum]|uniref:Uncharacterized protein n=1 Tax=Penicillium bovifimosum TaxID=126998 RepID=A0A9W9HHT4_9EURO|nr:uncharacterized protein N7515_000664 [Penicillium bovifimosum]KAJ5146100.1 hypothetical protein N7515_000664 [Penicillium bovifimosum]